MPSRWVALSVFLATAAHAQLPVSVGKPTFNRENHQIVVLGPTCTAPGAPFECDQGMMCASGCAQTGTRVGVFVEDRMLTTADAADGWWHAEVPIDHLERGLILSARDVGDSTLVLDDTSENPLWGLGVEAGVFDELKAGKAGLNIGVSPNLRPVGKAPWFGIRLRYSAALLSDQSIHRLNIGLDFDLVEAWFDIHHPHQEYHGLRVVVTPQVGGAFLTEPTMTGGTAIVAGLTLGLGLQVLIPVARRVWFVLRSGWELFIHGQTPRNFFDLASIGAEADF